jgi:uncharacterized paraquat-inducible protein A
MDQELKERERELAALGDVAFERITECDECGTHLATADERLLALCTRCQTEAAEPGEDGQGQD